MPAEDDYLDRLLQEFQLRGFAADTVRFLMEGLVPILLILAAALILSRVAGRFIRRSVKGVVARSVRGEQSSTRATVRAETLAGVSASFVRISIWTIAVLMALDKVGVNLGPLLAGASIVGVAVGLGAQSLVRDFLSGFFVLAEDQFGVGDTVTVRDVTGTVEEVNLRVTRLRAFDGTVWFVPNGEIRKVGNSAKEWARAIVDVIIPNKADLGAATQAIGEEAAALAKDPEWAECVLEEPEVLGVESLGAANLTVRVSTKTTPSHRAPLAREMRSRITSRLRRDGVVASEAPGSTDE